MLQHGFRHMMYVNMVRMIQFKMSYCCIPHELEQKDLKTYIALHHLVILLQLSCQSSQASLQPAHTHGTRNPYFNVSITP